MLAEPPAWQVTPFGRWVADLSVRRLTEQLADHGVPITRNAVYDWMSGRRVPRPEAALLIVDFAGGRLTFENIYRHPLELRAADSPIVKRGRQ